MTRLRSGFQPRQTRSPRRKTVWGIGPGGDAVVSVSADGKSFLGSGIVLVDELMATIMRLRGTLSMYLVTNSAVNDGFHCAMGIGLVDNLAFAAGVNSIPGPLTNANSDIWLYHRFFGVHGRTAGIEAGAPNEAFETEVDSKAMRKWSSDQTLVPIVEVVEASSATAAIWFDSRVLIKLT